MVCLWHCTLKKSYLVNKKPGKKVKENLVSQDKSDSHKFYVGKKLGVYYNKKKGPNV